jgi:hypothetical protein
MNVSMIGSCIKKCQASGLFLATIIATMTILVLSSNVIHSVNYAFGDPFSLPFAAEDSAQASSPTLSVDSFSSGKILVALMKATYSNQPELVNLYKPYIRSTDYVKMKPNTNNLNYAFQLVGMKGVEYFSLSEIKNNVATLKSKGINFISYDLEKSYSPSSDMADPVSSMRQASNVVHNFGLKFVAAPSHILTDKYYSKFAPLADVYDLQAQAFQPNPSSYQNYVDGIVPKLKTAHPGMPVITELSTNKGDLQNMKRAFSLVAGRVNGVVIWYSNTSEDINQISKFLAWFQQNYR